MKVVGVEWESEGVREEGDKVGETERRSGMCS